MVRSKSARGANKKAAGQPAPARTTTVRSTGTRGASKKAAGQPAPERRAELLEAAYEVIAEKGLEGLRTRDIAARAGVNISTLHYYFGTKEALIVALVDDVRERFIRANRAASLERATVRSHFEGGWRAFQATPHLSAVLQELSLRGQRDPATRAAFRSLHGGWNELVQDVIRSGVESGELRADLDVVAAARVMTSFVMGAMMQLGIHPRAFVFSEVARELERWMSREG
jgi:AcrR family transcriptional regulator